MLPPPPMPEVFSWSAEDIFASLRSRHRCHRITLQPPSVLAQVCPPLPPPGVRFPRCWSRELGDSLVVLPRPPLSPPTAPERGGPSLPNHRTCPRWNTNYQANEGIILEGTYLQPEYAPLTVLTSSEVHSELLPLYEQAMCSEGEKNRGFGDRIEKPTKSI